MCRFKNIYRPKSDSFKCVERIIIYFNHYHEPELVPPATKASISASVAAVAVVAWHRTSIPFHVGNY